MARYERGYERGERLGELLRRILADELARIADEELEFVTITGVKTDRELSVATVYFSTLHLDPDEESVAAEVLAGYRRRFGEAVRSESRLKRVPRLVFSPDSSMHSGARIEAILRGMEAAPPPAGRVSAHVEPNTPSKARDTSWPETSVPAAEPSVEEPSTVNPLGGFAVVDKAAGCTSHDVVARARKLLGVRRVGHAGTLDPDATGVLILGFGKATRLLRFVTALGKEYEAEVVLGAQTTTGDASGEVTQTWDMSRLGRTAASEAARGLLGETSQTPPMVSALKVDGRRLHNLAREGLTVERQPRKVRVSRFDVLDFEAGERPLARIQVACGSGTYVRTLAEDWGRSLGGGAHLRSLRRTAVGSFTVNDGRPVDSLELLPPAVGLRDYPSVSVDDEQARLVSFGRFLPVELAAEGDGPYAVHNSQGDLLAVYERSGNLLKPAVVLASAG